MPLIDNELLTHVDVEEGEVGSVLIAFGPV